MNRRMSRWQQAAPFAAGVLIGSVILLAVALMIKALGTRPNRNGSLERDADMRDANRVEMVDVPLHQ